MSPITWNSIQDHKRSRLFNFCFLRKSLFWGTFFPSCTVFRKSIFCALETNMLCAITTQKRANERVQNERTTILLISFFAYVKKQIITAYFSFFLFLFFYVVDPFSLFTLSCRFSFSCLWPFSCLITFSYLFTFIYLFSAICYFVTYIGQFVFSCLFTFSSCSIFQNLNTVFIHEWD